MLDKIDLSKKLGKKEAKKQIEELGLELSALQRECKRLQIPVMIVFEGWGSSGKGTLINKLIHPMDPRGFKVFSIQKESEEEQMRPFLWRFWSKTPEKGRIHIFDRSWYQRVTTDRVDKGMTEVQLADAFKDIMYFEENLANDNNLIIKLFLHISEKEQKKRLEKLASNDETKWRVTEKDWAHHKAYATYSDVFDEMIERTDCDRAPWTIIEATDAEYAEVKILTTVVAAMKAKVAAVEAMAGQKTESSVTAGEASPYRTTILDGVDLDKALTKDEYKKKLKKLQSRLAVLHNEIYRRRIPVVLAFEGWDAGGKGGAIKRLTEMLDPRGYEVVPTASPNDIEKAHHYLWRFWTKCPKAGHIAIFDRTWYGRVMVERIEGFCTETEWKRAYKEINEMENQFAQAGAVVLKFWLHIDKDEQERRFKERMETPEKQWKITDEDWRNRDKWDQYVEAVDEMILRTSTRYAPWIVVEGNDKYYARIKVLETVVEAIEEKIKAMD